MVTNTFTNLGVRPVSPLSSTVFGSLRRTMQRWKEEAHIRAELSTMSARELADLGLSASDIDDVARGRYRRG